MIDWNKELELIFNDPLLADVVAPKKRTTSSDRLIAGFQEINDFYEETGALPNKESNPKLFNYWTGILAKPDKIDRCRPFDIHNLLPQSGTVEEPAVEYGKPELSEEEQLEQILNDPLLSDITEGDNLGIFDMPDYMKERIAARKEADYVGRRVKCEDFDQYESKFKEIHAGLKSGKYRLVKFRDADLKVGAFFVEEGVIGYLASFEQEANDSVNAKKRLDGRTRVIYENGSEADLKYRTITKNLSVDGYSVQLVSDITETDFTITDTDVKSGIVYVLRSKSTRPEIAAIKNLYKIGFTVTSVESRIANAKNEPTYLCADVEIVATYTVFNIKSSTFEALIHKLFDCVKLNVTVDGQRPKEWFIVPLNIIDQAINNIIHKIPMLYDPKLQQLVRLHAHKGMKCLSVKQPWASLICMGVKDVENRKWKPAKAPGRILIHAGTCADKQAMKRAEKILGHSLPEMPCGAIIGYVDVYDFTEHSDSPWAGPASDPMSRWKWLLRNAKFFKEPIPYKGQLNLFDVRDIDPDNLPETL